jgi:uridylate kinase
VKNPQYKRVVLKLSGEALSGENGYGIDHNILRTIALEVKEVNDRNVEVAIVVLLLLLALLVLLLKRHLPSSR